MLHNSDVMLLPSVVSFSFLIAPPRRLNGTSDKNGNNSLKLRLLAHTASTRWLDTLPFNASTTLPELQMLCKARPSIAQMFPADSSHEPGAAALPGPGGVQKAPRVVRGGGQILKHFLYVA